MNSLTLSMYGVEADVGWSGIRSGHIRYSKPYATSRAGSKSDGKLPRYERKRPNRGLSRRPTVVAVESQLPVFDSRGNITNRKHFAKSTAGDRRNCETSYRPNLNVTGLPRNRHPHGVFVRRVTSTSSRMTSSISGSTFRFPIDSGVIGDPHRSNLFSYMFTEHLV